VTGRDLRFEMGLLGGGWRVGALRTQREL
jgi:hypothetical protein